MRKEKTPFKRIDAIIMSVIVIVGLALRLYGINNPLADFHSWRQADTAAVGRNFARDGFDLLHPRYDDISSIQSGIENPKGYRFVEFPVYSAIFAAMYKAMPFASIEFYARLTTALFSLVIVGILYYLVLKETGRVAAIVASGVYAVFPFFVFFSRVILPETTSLSFAFMAIFFLYLHTNTKGFRLKYVYLALSILTFALSVLVKPPTIVYALTFVYIFVSVYEHSVFKKPSVYLFFFVGLAPLVAWRSYILKYPEGIPPSDWLITSVNTYQGLKNIFFRPAFFRWIFFERLNIDILGGYLTMPFIVGVIQKGQRYFLHVILLCAVIYLFVFQGGNVQHEYYQTIILPAVAIMIGLGVHYIVRNQKTFIHPALLYPVLTGVFAFAWFFSYYRVKEFYHYPPELPQIASIIRTLTRPDDLIVTDRLGDTTLLYLTDRKGAPAIYKDPEELKNMGYSYLASTTKETIDKLKAENKYIVVFENDKFTLFKL